MNRKDNKEITEMRLDKWLWCTRFYKTRSIASNAIKSGKIKVNGERPKPSKMISPDDCLLIRKEAYRYEIIIRELPIARLPAAKAVLMYEETQESVNDRELTRLRLKTEAALFPRTVGRPSKRDRRELMKFRQTHSKDDS